MQSQVQPQISYSQLASNVKTLYRQDPANAAAKIESHLESILEAYDTKEKINIVENLAAYLLQSVTEDFQTKGMEDEILSKLFTLLLGKNVTQSDLSSKDLLKRLAASINTIFDSLNNLIGVMNSTLYGRSTGDETIRQVIGFHIEGESAAQSLETHIGQVSKAFLTAQQAFKDSTSAIVRQIMTELSPEKISESMAGGLKFGPFKRANAYDIYKQKYTTCLKWFESERFMESFLREFEKNCYKLSQKQGGLK